MANQVLPEEFLRRLEAVKSKRARIVIDHILKHGFVTTEELESVYGYKHPPRAARDVREYGIPLDTFRLKNAEGRTIGAYRFADPSTVRADVVGGRKAFSKKFKDTLVEAMHSRCGICLEQYEPRHLQVDHRVPYEVSGDSPIKERELDDYMLLCGSCNRAKSWSCEHCKNWLEIRDSSICNSCYWARPETYNHIALRPIRRLDIVWSEDEVALYEEIRNISAATQEALPAFVKKLIEKHLRNRRSP